MTIQLSVETRNARLDIIETTIGASPIMEIRSGAPPASCADPDSGTILASLALPADWAAAASGGSKSMLGTWEDTSADATGTAAHFRIKDNGGITCHMQGTVSMSGGGGDLIVDNTSFAVGQKFTVNTFTLIDSNA